MSLNYLVAFFVFLFGICIGSFLNCFIYRQEEKKSLKGRSFCPNCKHLLSWQDLFPVFSFLFLLGKCRYCKEKISWQYPLVEIFSGLLFVAFFSQADIIRSLYLIIIACLLIIIFVFDLKHYIIPDRILFPAIAVASAYDIYIIFLSKDPVGIFLNFVLAISIAAGLFLLIFLISTGKWMGFGDVKFAVLMGLLLGFPNVLSALFLAFFFGAIIGLITMAFKKKSFKSEMPFGPFLIIGTLVAIFWGKEIIQWYINLLII